jgi:hypothetical protein
MKKPNRRFERFLDLARQGRPAETESPPFGFATRVAARWASGPPGDPIFVWERLTRWGVAVACAVFLTTLAVSRKSFETPSAPTALEAFAGLADEEDSFGRGL